MQPTHERTASTFVATPRVASRAEVLERWLVSLALGACVAALAYATARTVQFLTLPPYDPKTALPPARIPFFGRLELAMVCGVVASLGAAQLRARDSARFDRALPGLIVATVVLTTLQAVFAP